jgi:hypothetical protein
MTLWSHVSENISVTCVGTTDNKVCSIICHIYVFQKDI